MAAALADIQPSLRVGLLDADVFGPSIPLMMNLSGKPLITEGVAVYLCIFNLFTLDQNVTVKYHAIH